jgi:hypothetical protein
MGKSSNAACGVAKRSRNGFATPQAAIRISLPFTRQIVYSALIDD